MNKRLHSLPDATLLEKTKYLTLEERRITLELIHHLQEVERRRLFLEMGYQSLYEFVIKYLGFSEGAAHRRISAMRLSCEVPEVKPAIQNGDLSLTTAAKLQGFFQAEKHHGRPVSIEKKREIIADMKGLSQRECEIKLFGISPTSVNRERERLISSTEVELKVIVKVQSLDKLSRIKGLLAHRLPGATNGEILEYLLSDALQKLEAKKTGETPKKIETVTSPASQSKVDKSGIQKRRARTGIPTRIRHAVWKKASGRCEFRSNEGKRCASQHALQIDHRVPVAIGGTNELENLRLLCSAHNRYLATVLLGEYPIPKADQTTTVNSFFPDKTS